MRGGGEHVGVCKCGCGCTHACACVRVHLCVCEYELHDMYHVCMIIIIITLLL